MRSKTSSMAFLRSRPIFKIHIGLVSRIVGDVTVGSRAWTCVDLDPAGMNSDKKGKTT